MAEPAPSASPVGGDRPGDEAFGRLLIDMQPRIRAFLCNLTRDGADDLVQETLARAWRSRRSFDARRGAPAAWLVRIAFRAFLDQGRHRGRSLEADAEDLPSPAPGPVEHATARERTASLLDALSSPEREVLLQFHRDGRSIAAIGRSLRLPEGTVKSHLHRARARLWELERAGGES